MKLLSVQTARSIWVVYLADLNPRGTNLLSILQPLVTRYNFQVFPTKPEELFGKEINEIKFLGGNFQKDPQQNIAVNLIIFTWGMVAETRSSTEDSDAFLHDFLTWASAEFLMAQYQEVLRTKHYLSELWIHTEKSLNSLNPKLHNFIKRLESLIEGHDRNSFGFETTGIILGPDFTGATRPGNFRFERLVDIPFKENRYYSAAPLQTDVHLKLLDEFESILK
jgi:hypothetical protein